MSLTSPRRAPKALAPQEAHHVPGDPTSPLLHSKSYDQPSVFRPENLLREGRRQRNKADIPVPETCLLDPDGDIVRHLTRAGVASEHFGWACYHTTLYTFDLNGSEVGIVACAVGAPFAVLVAEQLAASGCALLISVTSAGSITSVAEPPHFVLIEKALRDEGTSLHYLPPGQWAYAPDHLVSRLEGAFTDLSQPVITGATWTIDAPYRETTQAIENAERLGIIAVEMEAAALYAYATARHRDVICVAHVTNAMATDGDDFEKGEADGVHSALHVVGAIVTHLRGRNGEAHGVADQDPPS